MLQREKAGCRLHFEPALYGSKWLSSLPSIDQVDCQSCKSGYGDVPGGPSSKESRLTGEQTLLIKENLKQSQSSLFQLNEPVEH